MDKAYQQSNRLLSSLDNELNQLYSRSRRRIQREAKPILNKMYLDDEKVTQQERLKHAEKYKEELVLLFVSIMLSTNERAINKTNDKIARMYILNYDYMIDKIEKLVKKDLGLKKFGTIDKAEDLVERTRGYYSRRAHNRLVDEVRLAKTLDKRLKTTIKQGGNVDELEKELKRVANKSKNSSRLTASTETTRIINTARFAVFGLALSLGVKLKKTWRHSGLGKKPRHWHMHMNGETTNIKEPFSNGLIYPGEIGSPAKQVINCRCFLDVELE